MGAALTESTACNFIRLTSSLQVYEPVIPLVDLCDSDEDIKPDLKSMQAEDESTDDENIVNKVMAKKITNKFVAILREQDVCSADLGDDNVEELLCAFLE